MYKPVSVAIALGLLFVGGVSAQHDKENDEGKMVLGGMALLNYRSTEGGMTPKQRVSVTYDRLRRILSDPNLKASDITSRPTNDGDVTIQVKDRLLTTVCAGDAAANHSTPKVLAAQWLGHLKKVLPGLQTNATAGQRMSKMGKPNKTVSQKKLRK